MPKTQQISRRIQCHCQNRFVYRIYFSWVVEGLLHVRILRYSYWLSLTLTTDYAERITAVNHMQTYSQMGDKALCNLHVHHHPIITTWCIRFSRFHRNT